MQPIRHKILILSGKGGVGKSTLTSQLAFALADDENQQVGFIERGRRCKKFNAKVGVMDIDVCGPSIPRILGLEGETIHQSNFG